MQKSRRYRGEGRRGAGLQLRNREQTGCILPKSQERQGGVRQGGNSGQTGGGGQVVGRLSLCPVPTSSLCQALPSPTHHMGVSLDSRSGQELQELSLFLSAMRTSHRVPECASVGTGVCMREENKAKGASRRGRAVAGVGAIEDVGEGVVETHLGMLELAATEGKAS